MHSAPVQAIRSEVVAEFEVAGTTHHVRIYPAVANLSENDKNKHNFFHSPVMLPISSGDKSLLVKHVPHSPQAEIIILLSSNDVRQQGLALLRTLPGYNKLPDTALRPIPFNRIRALPHTLPHDIQITLGEVQGGLSQPATMPVRFGAPTAERLNQFIETGLPGSVLAFQVELQTAVSRGARVHITGRSLRESTFRVALHGDGSDSFVHRDDFRRLTMGISNNLSITGVVDDGESLDWAIVNAAMDRFYQQGDSALVSWSDSICAQTFNGKDLKPSEVQNSLNKLFKLDSGDDRFHVNSAEHHAAMQEEQRLRSGGSYGYGKAGFSVGFFGGSASGGGGAHHHNSNSSRSALSSNSSFSRDELHQFLQQHGVETSIQGNLIEVRDVKVRRFNHSELSDNLDLGYFSVTIKDRDDSYHLTLPLNGEMLKLAKDVRDVKNHLKEIDDQKPDLADTLRNLGNRVQNLEDMLSVHWHDAHLEGYLKESGYGLARPGYCKLGNVVHLRGSITNNQTWTNEMAGQRGSYPLFTLPEGFRPSGWLKFPAVGQDGSGIKPKSVTITGDGKVSYWLSGFDVNCFVSLDGISFVVSQ